MSTQPVAGALPVPSVYPRTSRYFGIPTAVHTTSDGRQLPYLRRRLLPDPASLTEIGVHVVRAGDRADQLAHQGFGDVEQWFRLADANPVLHPDELTATPGRRLRLTLPAGIPAPPSANAGTE
jgi:hypothetical protein